MRHRVSLKLAVEGTRQIAAMQQFRGKVEATRRWWPRIVENNPSGADADQLPAGDKFKATKALGLTVLPPVLAHAEELIE